MKQAKMTFQVVLNFQFSSTPTLNALNKKSKNIAPCTGPSAFDNDGLP